MFGHTISRSVPRTLTTLALAFGLLPSPHGSEPGPGFDVFPVEPTSADVVEIRLNGGSKTAFDVADRVTRMLGDPMGITNTFFQSVRDLDTHETFLLGALAPGDYKFILYLSGGSGPACFSRAVAELHFSVQAAAKIESGHLTLVVDSNDDAVIDDVVEALNPTWRHFFPTLDQGTVNVPLGLTSTYADRLATTEGVVDVDLVGVGHGLGHCGPPLHHIARGKLSLTLSDEVDVEAFHELVRRQLPERESYDEQAGEGLKKGPWTTSVLVRVPAGWERYFLGRYLEDPRVLQGTVIPNGASTSHSRLPR